MSDPATAHEAVVVGGGPGGLAAAAMLGRAGLETVVLERASRIGDTWRGHYDRLHLHTTRWGSHLPGLRIPRREGRWVSRDGVARYLEGYARHHALRVRVDSRVETIERADGSWLVRTGADVYRAPVVVVATGFNRVPRLPPWPGRASFEGELVHSSAYRNAAPYRGRDVLVVGTGNSGAEIAVDLVEGGAKRVRLAVRTPPNILPRSMLGMPTQLVAIAVRRWPPRAVDAVARATQRLAVGDLSPFGLPPPPRGLYSRLLRDDIIPILDVGLIGMLRARRVDVVAAVERLEGTHVVLRDGSRLAPDALIAATGYRRGLEEIVGHLGIVGPGGRPIVHGAVTDRGAPDLYFLGFTNPISGNLRELGIDARRIARAAAAGRRAAGDRTA